MGMTNRNKTENLLFLTENAITEVKGIIAAKNIGEVSLRVGVEAGGCSGMTYQLSFEKASHPDDISFDAEGVRVVVDPKSALFLTGTTLDFSRDLVGGGFKFINPNAKGSCGCGESFSA